MAKMKDLSEYMGSICVHFLELIEIDGSIDNVIGEEQKRGIDVSAYYVRSTKENCEEGMIAHIYHCNLCNEEERHEVKIETDSVYIGDCPHEEDPYKKYNSLKVARAFVLQLKNSFVEPLGANIRVNREQGGGGYYDVVCDYSTEYPYSLAFALMLESSLPEKWSPAAKRFLEGN